MKDIMITINLTYVWIVTKALLAGYFTKKQLQYPIWKDGVQIKRPFHRKVQIYFGHCIYSPEWSMLKMVAFLPVALFTGKKFLHKFMPWHISSPPPCCSKCNDTGKYKIGGFVKGLPDVEYTCDCRKVEAKQSYHKCNICLDEGNIGPYRPCPHCKNNYTSQEVSQKNVEKYSYYDPYSDRQTLSLCYEFNHDAAADNMNVGDVVFISSLPAGHKHIYLVKNTEGIIPLRIKAVDLPYITVGMTYQNAGVEHHKVIDTTGVAFRSIYTEYENQER